MTEPLYCDGVAKRYGFELDCCDSCHEDANEYGFPLEEVTLVDGTVVQTCCYMGQLLDALGLIPSEE